MLKTMIRAGVLLPPFLFAGLAKPVLADDFQSENSRQEHVQVTATRRAADEFDVSAATNVVGKDELEELNPDVMAQALRGLPGLWFQQTTPGQGIPIIRGLKGSQVLHLVDGMRINNAFFRNAPNQYLGLIDSYASKSIEVVRGASGSLYGSDAMGGVVNVITEDLAIGSGESFHESYVYGALASADNGISARASTLDVNGDHGFSMGISYQERGDRETGAGIELIPSGFRSRAADAKYAYQLDEQSDLTLAVQWMEQPSTPRVDELLAGFNQDQAPSAEFYFEPNDRRFLHARYRRDDGDWYDQFTVNIARQVINDDRRNRDSGSVTRRTEQNRSTLDGITIQFDHDLLAGPFLTWGIELYQDTIRSARQSTDINTGSIEAVGSRFPDGSTLDSQATYLSADWRPNDRIDFSAGLRYSSFDISLAGTNHSQAADLTPEDVTGDLHLVWFMNSNTHMMANVGRGFRAPNIFDLGTLGPRPGNRFNVANPALGPESVWSYDLGIKHRDGRLELETYVFYMDYQDKITSVFTGETTESGRTVVRAENINDVTLYGLESGLRWAHNDRLNIEATLNLTRGTENDSSGFSESADRIPPVNGRIGLSYAVSDTLELKTSLLFAAGQDRLSSRDVDDPRINPLGTPGWGTLNLAFNWQLDRNIRLGLGLENLGDKAYREHASGIDARGRSASLFISRIF